jgi:hypothetical protein
VTEGFEKLWEKRRLDLSVETLVLNTDFKELFTEEERIIAKTRLAEYGYTPLTGEVTDVEVCRVSISFDGLVVGKSYDRQYLAEKWGYKDWHALARGIVTPKDENKIILFVTKIKQDTQTQYNDYIEGGILHMEGETNHQHDERIIGTLNFLMMKYFCLIEKFITLLLFTLGKYIFLITLRIWVKREVYLNFVFLRVKQLLEVRF